MTKANPDTTEVENLMQSSQALWLRFFPNALNVAPKYGWCLRGGTHARKEDGCWWLEDSLENSQMQPLASSLHENSQMRTTDC